MPSLGMYGPYALSDQQINHHITQISAGNYALGNVNERGLFVVRYVGRSDANLNARLKTWTGKGYQAFKFAYATSPKAAFEKECRNFHDFGGTAKLDNNIHPDRPAGSGWNCPVCRIFG